MISATVSGRVGTTSVGRLTSMVTPRSASRSFQNSLKASESAITLIRGTALSPLGAGQGADCRFPLLDPVGPPSRQDAGTYPGVPDADVITVTACDTHHAG